MGYIGVQVGDDLGKILAMSHYQADRVLAWQISTINFLHYYPEELLKLSQ